MKSNLKYVTYQSFPSLKANTIQTIDNVNYLSKYYNVEVIFPLREKDSTDNKSVLENYYHINEKITFSGISHRYPFGKFNYFNKLSFVIRHFMWSKKYIKKISKTNKDTFFTRSDWIFYFLSLKNMNVTFECHQLSRIRKFVMRKSIINPNSKIIFLNTNLLLDSKIDQTKYKEKLIVLHNGVDYKLFSKNVKKDKNQIIFVGNLKRFNESRNLEFFISAFNNPDMPDNLSFTVIGHPEEEIKKLETFVIENNLEKKIKILDRLQRESAIAQIQKSSIGLLINTDDNSHSIRYTSPLKYFEYLYAGLKIVAVNFPSHHDLPFSENIIFYELSDDKSFINALIKAFNVESPNNKNIEVITLEYRAKEIFNFIS